MKTLSKLFIVLIALFALYVLISFFLPSVVHIERSSKAIHAAPTQVFEQINNLKNWKQWSYWDRIDPSMKSEYSGPESGAGATHSWSSENDSVGNGTYKILRSEPDSLVEAELSFEGMGTSTNGWKVKNTEEGTVVTCYMDKEVGFFGRIFPGLLMESFVASDFDTTLSNLKIHCDALAAKPKTYRGFQITEKDAPEIVYICKKDSIGWDKIGEFFSKNFSTLFGAVGKQKLECIAPPSGIYFKWDEANKITVMAAAVAVKGDAGTKLKGYETFVLSAGKMLQLAYYGAYEKTAEAHYGMDDYMKEKGLTLNGPVIEEYVTDPKAEPDTAKWLTNIYYPVK